MGQGEGKGVEMTGKIGTESPFWELQGLPYKPLRSTMQHPPASLPKVICPIVGIREP
jgi:hypothetical protein